MNKFEPEQVTAKVAQLPSVHISHVPKISQFALEHAENGRFCSPVSCTMLVQYLTKFAIDPIQFASRSYDAGLNAYGSWPFNMAHAFERCNGKNWFFTTRLNSFTDLYNQLMRGIPVVVSVRGTLPRAPRSYPHGHLLIVVGWDSETKEVICHDPAMDQHYTTLKRYRLYDFLHSWEQSRRLTYWAERV